MIQRRWRGIGPWSLLCALLVLASGCSDESSIGGQEVEETAEPCEDGDVCELNADLDTVFSDGVMDTRADTRSESDSGPSIDVVTNPEDTARPDPICLACDDVALVFLDLGLLGSSPVSLAAEDPRRYTLRGGMGSAAPPVRAEGSGERRWAVRSGGVW